MVARRNRESAKHAVATACFLLCALSMWGCFKSWLWYPDQQPWTKLLELGGAREITAWTLMQDDTQAIADGVSALWFTARRESNQADAREKSQALTGLYQIAQKRAAGWPAHPDADRAPSPRIIIWNIAMLASRDSSLLETYFALEPGIDEPEELREAWRAAAEEFRLSY